MKWVIASVVVFASVAWGEVKLKDDAPDAVRQIAAQADLLRDKMRESAHRGMERARHILEDVEAGRVVRSQKVPITVADRGERSVYRFASDEIKQKKIASASQDVEDAKDRIGKADDPRYIPVSGNPMRDDLRSGYFCRFEFIKVVSIADDSNLLAEVVVYHEATRRSGDRMIGALSPEKIPVWIVGYPTADLFDGSRITIPETSVLYMDGSERYEAIDGGMNTVPRFQVVNVAQWIQE